MVGSARYLPSWGDRAASLQRAQVNAGSRACATSAGSFLLRERACPTMRSFATWSTTSPRRSTSTPDCSAARALDRRGGGVRRLEARQPPAAAVRATKLGGPPDVGRRNTRARKSEPDPLHRRRHRHRGRTAPQRRAQRSATTSSRDPAGSRSSCNTPWGTLSNWSSPPSSRNRRLARWCSDAASGCPSAGQVSRSRSSRFRILPLALRGSSSTKTTRFGFL